ncbi:hypothetical protein HYT23_06915, partial [Candidatus Pacearchaeota archaeon]|nr:hypothetical protein [Candidatus Pacearchaeota archaeon]
MTQIFKKSYIYWIILIFILYIALNIIFSGFYNTIKLIIIYANTVDWLKLGISIILTLVIGFLVAVNSVTAYIKYKERKKCKEGVATASVGTVGGLIVGVCPLCVTGLFPLIFSALGLGFSFGSLPFGGIEIQVLVVIILGIS